MYRFWILASPCCSAPSAAIRRSALPAVQVSVGRLGVLTSVTLSIVTQRAVQRLLQTTSAINFTAQLMIVQEAYKAAVNNGSADALGAALSQVDETQVLSRQHDHVVPIGDLIVCEQVNCCQACPSQAHLV